MTGLEVAAPTLGGALTVVSELLTYGWTFISTNPILFGVACLGLGASAIFVVKSLFH